MCHFDQMPFRSSVISIKCRFVDKVLLDQLSGHETNLRSCNNMVIKDERIKISILHLFIIDQQLSREVSHSMRYFVCDRRMLRLKTFDVF